MNLSCSIGKKVGAQAEDFACQYLQTQGLILLARNYTCRLGEIDLIMQDKNTLVFVEVRYRKPSIFGHSLETIRLPKQLKLIKTAHYYLQYHAISEEIWCRFDVVGISLLIKPHRFKAFPPFKSATPQVEWVKNAFPGNVWIY
jgi:putative endonuclease